MSIITTTKQKDFHKMNTKESDDEKFLKSCSVVRLAASSAHAKVCGTDGDIGALRRVPNYCYHWDTLSQQHVSLR
jgi:hypothetical protein